MKPLLAVDLVVNSVATDSTAGTITVDAANSGGSAVGTALLSAVDGDEFSIFHIRWGKSRSGAR